MTHEDTDLLSAKNWGVHSLRVATGRPFVTDFSVLDMLIEE
jgi:hypothetical protein